MVQVKSLTDGCCGMLEMVLKGRNDNDGGKEEQTVLRCKGRSIVSKSPLTGPTCGSGPLLHMARVLVPLWKLQMLILTIILLAEYYTLKKPR